LTTLRVRLQIATVLSSKRATVRVLILAQLPNLPQQLRSVQVLARFCLRMVILAVFAAFGSIGFGRSLIALLWMSAILSAVIGALRREPPFDTVLNHWDETLAYAALCCLVSGLIQSTPF
jgi:VIT1/CCC1 family predicted Fe2+/Mn2+ transporter